MKPIEQKIETLQDIAANVSGLLQKIQHLRGVADSEIAGDGLTPETCAATAAAMRQLHKDTHGLFVGGHLVHAEMLPYVPEDANEGQKPWPP